MSTWQQLRRRKPRTCSALKMKGKGENVVSGIAVSPVGKQFSCFLALL
ncbi:hypothetical protein HMPREF1861_00331 [Corynebacterium kroppenstedtii]|nr:hypothetical protein HMPREF1861_00331 [Corynebacterium kroppenstedtii]